MLVEDDDAIREMAADILGDEGYHVVASADAEHALTQLTRACPFDLLLSDICLPGMNGRDLADQARMLYPALPIVFMTGYAGEIAKRADFLDTGMRLLTKPFSLRELLGTVQTAL
ncbi:two-component system response regulator [Xanthomonas axonopodis pv. khayae]|uniref:Response regulator n=4 Tax=Xanthomonas citri TaxID=346 RepID=A0AB33CUB4_XANCI|nr:MULTISPECIES: response regulator [Xanthomonas]MBO9748057.1 response regulator [Xanthomonas phaseoli pv. dieffenbachiae]MBV6782199.1 response regulator [Xanthomonas campestris pv. trichodesmae]MEE5089026.1 response regulator [Xanthomonas euvesicatoria]AMV00795.1 chemotaxis protein CheY [Xanthomonas citri pv. aurantifolii]AMV05156.1 chemotaxis protein CheY [Xanthomonas citri pv. aurantifolii]